MFTPIVDLPDTTVGFTAHGKIHADDYSKTLIPAIEELILRTGAARVLLVLGSDWTAIRSVRCLTKSSWGSNT